MDLVASADPRLVEFVVLSPHVSLSAVLIASAIGMPPGAALAVSRCPGRRAVIVITNALAGLPPVVLGPQADPARVAGGKDITAALKAIEAAQARFVSRGDRSGAHAA